MSSFNWYIRYCYGKTIQKIENNVKNFLRTLDVHNLDVHFKGFNEQYELIEEMGWLIMERVNVKMTNDASSNSFIIQQMSTTELLQSTIDGSHDTTMSE